jgi:hypothetical protein
MRARLLTLILGTALVGGSLMAGAPARAADVTVGVGPVGIAFGYADGYWDRGHNWHAWKDHAEAERWRAANHEHYFDWRHDRDGDKGWRESDHYWDHH